MKNQYEYELDSYGDRWTGNGHGIVNVSANTPEQQKIVDEWNAAHESAQKEKPRISVEIVPYRIGSTDAAPAETILNPLGLKEEYQTLLITVCRSDGTEARTALIVQEDGSLENLVVKEDDRILILRRDMIYVMDAETAALVRVVQVDCYVPYFFGIYPKGEKYILHGELEIMMLDGDLNRVWVYTGRDIFAAPDNREVFRMEEDRILLEDFMGNRYIIDYEGKRISEWMIDGMKY